MKAIVHAVKNIALALVIVEGAEAIKASAAQLVKQAKEAGGTLTPSTAEKFLNGTSTDLMGWKVLEGEFDAEGKFVQAAATETTTEVTDTTEGTTTDGQEAGAASGPVDPLLAQLDKTFDPGLAAAESALAAAASSTPRRVASTSGQSGQRQKRVDRVTQLMAEHPDLKPMFDMFAEHGMDVPQKLRNIRPTGNTVWFDAVGKGDELMIVKEASGYKLNHKNVTGGKVKTIESYSVPSLDAIFQHKETMEWIGLQLK